MQASTVLMLVVGLALEFGSDWSSARQAFLQWIKVLEKSPVEKLQAFIESESETYREGNCSCYHTDDFAITVFTDTTERAPTFNLAPFDNPKQITERHSLTYTSIPSATDSLAAWRSLLARDPRALAWPEIHPKTSADYLLSFDFSAGAMLFRQKLLPEAHHFPFLIHSIGKELVFQFRGLETRFSLSGQNALFDHLTLKMLLNLHSTLVMGRLQRFEGNLMTWLFPSNGKLVDRAARYTQILLAQKGILNFSYDDIIRAQFACKPGLSSDQSIVHRTMETLLNSIKR